MNSVKSFPSLFLLSIFIVCYCTANREYARRDDAQVLFNHEHVTRANGIRTNGHNRSNGHHNGHKNGHSAKFQSTNTKTENEQKTDDESKGVVPASRCRHHYAVETENAINRQISLFIHADYVYSSMAQHFGRCDVALPGFQKFFQQLSGEQRGKWEGLMAYQNLRGGAARLSVMSAPTETDWGTGIEAMKRALEMEKKINQALVEVYGTAQLNDDFHALAFMQSKYITPQVDKIFTLSQYISSLERAGDGLGEFLFDKLPQN